MKNYHRRRLLTWEWRHHRQKRNIYNIHYILRPSDLPPEMKCCKPAPSIMEPPSSTTRSGCDFSHHKQMVCTQSSENMGSGLRVYRVLTVGNAVTHLWLSLERLVPYHRRIMAERPTVLTCWHQKSDFFLLHQNLSLFLVRSKRNHLRYFSNQAWYWPVDVSFTVPVTWVWLWGCFTHCEWWWSQLSKALNALCVDNSDTCWRPLDIIFFLF